MTLQVILARELFVAQLARQLLSILMVELDVRLQPLFSVERLVALVAVELQVAGVMRQMGAQLCSLYKTFVANFTNVWALTCVNFHVPVERLLGGETALADCAAIRSFAGVHATMLAQCPIGRERLFAQIAGERLLTSVRTNVDVQQGRSVERLFAVRTLVVASTCRLTDVTA